MLALFLYPVFSRISVDSVGAIDDLLLTCRGNEMAPAICDGDTVRVRICVNGTLIHAGTKNSTHPGDIIVYCAAAAVPEPQSMWMCGRAVNKYRIDGEWCFKTQMDSSLEPDAWEVPEHYLLGIVDEVMHGANRQDYETTPNASPQFSNGEDPSHSNVLTLVVDLVTGIGVGVIIGVIMAKVHAEHKNRFRLAHAWSI